MMDCFGLFSQVYIRVIALIVVSLGIMLALFQMHEHRTYVRALHMDLNQEARWMARHWQNSAEPDLLAYAWAQVHDGVQLQVVDGAGVVISDSRSHRPDAGGDEPRRILAVQGRSAIMLETGEGELVLTRQVDGAFPLRSQIELLLAALGLSVLAGLLLFPLIRNLTNSFTELSALAARVADGQFGATIPEEGAADIVAVIASFNEMSRRLKQAEIKNQRLLRDISHELRSPLARFSALVETAKRHPDELDALSARLQDEIGLMNRLVGDLILAARLESPEPNLDLEPTNIGEWLEGAAARLEGAVAAKGIAWHSEIPSGGKLVRIDAQRFMQVLGNVTDNAIHALRDTVDGCISIKLSIGTAAIITLSDNGPGISEKDLPFVFDRFYRIDEGRAQTDGGAGLGLSIVKAIVDAHGGSIEIASVRGQGANVHITLPLAPAA